MAHKTFGYVVILISQGAIFTGGYIYSQKGHPLALTLVTAHLIAFFGLLTILEFRHRRYLSTSDV